VAIKGQLLKWNNACILNEIVWLCRNKNCKCSYKWNFV